MFEFRIPSTAEPPAQVRRMLQPETSLPTIPFDVCRRNAGALRIEQIPARRPASGMPADEFRHNDFAIGQPHFSRRLFADGRELQLKPFEPVHLNWRFLVEQDCENFFRDWDIQVSGHSSALRRHAFLTPLVAGLAARVTAPNRDSKPSTYAAAHSVNLGVLRAVGAP